MRRKAVIGATSHRESSRSRVDTRKAVIQSKLDVSVSTDSVLGQIAALDSMSIADLRTRWRELFGADAPRHSRPYIISRLAYRIQELAYGGLRPETLARLDALADEIDRELKGDTKLRSAHQDRPIAGTRLIREWQGIEHCVTVRHDDYEYQGRPYKSLSAIARAITGTRWNGWLFFGLRNMKGAANGRRPHEA